MTATETQMSGTALPLEIERKFLIRTPDTASLQKMPGCRVLQMEQVYLLSAPGETHRTRRVEENGRRIFYETVKRPVTGVTRVEIEKQIPEEEYLLLLEKEDPARHPICKTRYCLPFGGKTFEIDVYPFWSDRAILEVELASEKEAIRFPPGIEILREVTEEAEYRNSSLALKIPEEEPVQAGIQAAGATDGHE